MFLTKLYIPWMSCGHCCMEKRSNKKVKFQSSIWWFHVPGFWHWVHSVPYLMIPAHPECVSAPTSFLYTHPAGPTAPMHYPSTHITGQTHVMQCMLQMRNPFFRQEYLSKLWMLEYCTCPLEDLERYQTEICNESHTTHLSDKKQSVTTKCGFEQIFKDTFIISCFGMFTCVGTSFNHVNYWKALYSLHDILAEYPSVLPLSLWYRTMLHVDLNSCQTDCYLTGNLCLLYMGVHLHLQEKCGNQHQLCRLVGSKDYLQAIGMFGWN